MKKVKKHLYHTPVLQITATLLLLWGIVLNAAAQQKLIKPSGDSVLLIGKEVSVLLDKAQKLTPETALEDTAFSYSHTLTPDYYSFTGNLWVKFMVINTTSKQDLVLDVNYPLLDQVTLYQFSKKEIISEQKQGFSNPFNSKKYKVQSFVFDLNLPPGDTSTYLLKIKSIEPLILPLEIGPANRVLAGEVHRDILTGIYAGIIIALFFYNIFIYISIKDISYLYYLIYIFFFAFTQLFLQGYGLRLFWPGKPWLNPYSIIIFVCCAGIAAIKFIVRFLNIKTVMPWANKVFNLFCLVYLIAAVLVFAGGYRYSFRIIDANAAILVIFSFIISFIIARKGSTDAIFFLIAWSVFILAMIVFVCKNVGLLPYNNFTNYVLYLGSSVEAILLSIALANRINIYKKEKETLLLENNAHQQNLINMIIIAQEEERRRIAEDLHDDVGATLSALTMSISNVPAETERTKDFEKYHDQSLRLSNKAVNDIRTIAHNLLPKDFKTTGLFKILDKKTEELNTFTFIKFSIITEGDEQRLTEVFAVTIYRVINELINNILKHSLASEAVIQVLIEENRIQIMAEDDGVGFNRDEARTGIGLKNITGRVEFLKGRIMIDSNNSGTHTIIDIPL